MHLFALVQNKAVGFLTVGHAIIEIIDGRRVEFNALTLNKRSGVRTGFRDVCGDKYVDDVDAGIIQSHRGHIFGVSAERSLCLSLGCFGGFLAVHDFGYLVRQARFILSS